MDRRVEYKKERKKMVRRWEGYKSGVEKEGWIEG